MYKAVLRVQPMTEKDLVGARMHQQREYEVANADQEREVNNRVLITGKNKDLVLDAKAVIATAPLANSKTTKVAADMILTASAEYFDKISPNWRTGELTPAGEKWVSRNVAFLQNKYGAGVVSAVLHMDEDAPHIHAIIVPLHTYLQRFRRGEKEVTKVNYVKVFGDNFTTIKEAQERGSVDTDTNLGRLQTEYADWMTGLGLERGTRNSKAKGKKPDHEKGRAAVEKRLVETEQKLDEALGVIAAQNKEIHELRTENDNYRAKDAIKQPAIARAADSIGVTSAELDLAYAAKQEQGFRDGMAAYAATGSKISEAGRRSSGPIVHVTEWLVVQDVGKSYVAHRPSKLGGWPIVGQKLTIDYQNIDGIRITDRADGRSIGLKQVYQR